jgi:hypothetical protein
MRIAFGTARRRFHRGSTEIALSAIPLALRKKSRRRDQMVDAVGSERLERARDRRRAHRQNTGSVGFHAAHLSWTRESIQRAAP